jgi:hypothetical protein
MARCLGWSVGLVSALVVAAGCGGGGGKPEEKTHDYGDSVGIGMLGRVVEVRASKNVLVLAPLAVNTTTGGEQGQARSQPALGDGQGQVLVWIRPDTEISIGSRASALEDVGVGMAVLAVGTETADGLSADAVTDLSQTVPAAESELGRAFLAASRAAPQRSAAPSTPQPRVTSLCLGQGHDAGEVSALDFQGCWGGPSASDDIDLPNIPLFCPLVGCFMLDRFSYSLALGGWGYDFPFDFTADPPPAGLVYHVPADVLLKVTPVEPSEGSFSFAGGLGADFGLNIDFCGVWARCYNVYTFHFSWMSMIQQSTEPGPLEGHMDIEAVACPEVGLIEIEGVPIDPLAIGLCQGLGLDGRPFYTSVTSAGARPGVAEYIGFLDAGATRTLRPEEMTVDLDFGAFSWKPVMTQNFYFEVTTFRYKLWKSAALDLGEMGEFDAIPLGPDVFTVPTDPASPPGAPRYLYQPTSTRLRLPVAKAPTQLVFTSDATLAQGATMTVRLGEAYDGTAIAGAPVHVVKKNLKGWIAFERTMTTDADGVVRLEPALGSWVVTADYAGSETYLPASAEQAVTVLRTSACLTRVGAVP